MRWKKRVTSRPTLPPMRPAEDQRQEMEAALIQAMRGAELRERQLVGLERQLVELNHRTANTLLIASSLILAQRDCLSDDYAKAALDAASARVQAIARLHQHLSQHGSGTQHVDLGQFIAELSPAIGAAAGLVCELDIEPVNIPADTALHLALAVNELVLNARKHAYGWDGGSVRIGCCRDGHGCLQISVADHGRGLPDGFDPQRVDSLGMSILQATTRQLGGVLKAENDHGARFTLLLPLD